MELWVIIIIVGLAAAYLVKKAVSAANPKVKSACSCGCSGCNVADNCSDFDGAVLPQVPEDE